MAKQGKHYRAAKEKVEKKSFPLVEALKQVKELAFAKFDESVDANVNLGIDASKGEQVVRGSIILPHSFGKKVKVIVFAKGDYAEQAKEAGADEIGADDLIDKIEGGWLDFDVAVSTPDMMGKVGKLAKLLGPKGLLPNKKLGTVTFDIGPVVRDLKKGQKFFKNDKSGLVHFTIGKVSFSPEQLKENLESFMKALVASRPATAKGKFIKKLTLSSTMGVGFHINADEIVG
ncbi:MAG: 50S ribosomal protein L1 [Candidatus Babeliales bacterium]